MRRIIVGAMAAISLLSMSVAVAAESWTYGHIIDVTYASDYVMIRLDNAVPTNCTGTPSGWMQIPSANKPMTAFITGLWMRGDAAQVAVYVYTAGIVGGYCNISQIDPAG